MPSFCRRLSLVPVLIAAYLPPAQIAHGQAALTWDQVVQRFQVNNPALNAQRTMIEEMRANEITAGLRPNPQLSLTSDQWALFSTNPFRPFGAAQTIVSGSQLIERRRKRPLRIESARLATDISGTDLADLERQLRFALRDAFVRLLQANSVLELSRENMAYYDKVIEVNRRRFETGAMARSDYERIALQRAQYESDLQTAIVNVRTAKIQLLSLMNDNTTPVDTFDVAGTFDFSDKIMLPEELHRAALESRGDIRSADTLIRKADVDHRLAWANGSWDPQVGGDYTRVGPSNTLGAFVSIPVRIFDRNQGEKARTAAEIRRAQQARDAVVNTAFRDIDTAFAQVESVRTVVRPYRDTYLPQAARVRDSVSYAYSRGGASLLDFLDAQKAYRDTQLAYRNLIGGYLTAVNQLNFAVGKEVLE